MKKASTSQRLKELMSIRNLKQVDILNKVQPLCKKYQIKLGSNDLSQYVTGKVEPSQRKLSIIAEALGINEVWLMGYDIPMTKKNDGTSDAVKDNFSSNLKKAREECKMTQEQLGRIIGEDRLIISKWENGTRTPTFEDILKLSEILHISFKELVGSNFKINKMSQKTPVFQYKDEESGLSVEIIETKDLKWDKLTKEEKEHYINKAMDSLYEAKKEIINKK